MTRGFLRIVLDAFRNNDDNFGGALRSEGVFEVIYSEGVGDGEINRLYDSKQTLEVPVGAGGLVLDLQALATRPDATLDANTIKVLWIEPGKDNDSAILVEPDTVAPWLGLFQSPGRIIARAGELLCFASRIGWPVTAGSKNLKLSHTGGASQFVTVKILASTL